MISKIKNIKFLFFVIVLLQIVLLVFYMNNKVCFFCDEIYSYSLSNSPFQTLFQPIGLNNEQVIETDYKWLDGKLFNDYITASENNRFNYSNVYHNQTVDSHPPFYYYLLHTICSLFPNTYSKWYGFFINICCFIIIQILLFVTSKEIFKSEKYALLTCLLFGFSSSAIDCHIYIRMYSLVTVFNLLLLYLYIICFNSKISVFKQLSIALVIIIGSLTHYHFFVYAFFLTLTFISLSLINKNYKQFWSISLSSLFGVIISIIYYPYLFVHLKTSPRGTEVFELLDRISPVFKAYAYIWKEFLGLGLKFSTYLSLLLFTVGVIFVIVYLVNNYFKDLNQPALKITIITTFCYCLLVSLSVNYRLLGFITSERFYLPISFAAYIMLVMLLYKLKNIYLSSFLVIITLLSGIFMLDYYYSYSNKKYAPILELNQLISGSNLIICTNYKEAIQGICPTLSKADKIYIIPKNFDENLLPEPLSNNKHQYLFIMSWNKKKKIPFKNILNGYLWGDTINYEVYDMSIKE